MFTMAQIDDVHARFGSSDSLAEYFDGLAAIGVARFESFVRDGHTEFIGAHGHRVSSPPHHDFFLVAETSDPAAFLEHLRRHAEGETSYVEMSAGLAASGVEAWVGDTIAGTMTYRDRAGTILRVEHVRTPATGQE